MGQIGRMGHMGLAGIALGIILFFGILAAKAYEPVPTHSLLARKTAEIYNNFYNANFSNANFSPEEVGWIQEGARNEDTPPRWINHFYDPITGKGWTSERMGSVPTGVLQMFSKLALSTEAAAPAPQWAQDQLLQVKYDSYQGNRTFQKAVFDYVQGDKKEGLKSLGHILHLVQDMTVPAHTRQDTHYDAAGDPGEPYEKWAKNNTDLAHLNSLNPKQENFSCANLNDCFIKVAKYSNENFFSEDTILDDAYRGPAVKDYIFIDGKKVAIGVTISGDKVFLFTEAKPDAGKKFTVDNDLIHQSYWRLLSKEAVLGGAEIMRLFFEEVNKAQKDKSILETPPPKPVSVFSNLYTGVHIVSSPSGYAVFSVFGEYEKLKNSAKQTIGAVNSFFSSAAAKVSATFSAAIAPISVEYSSVSNPVISPTLNAVEGHSPLEGGEGENPPQPSFVKGGSNSSPTPSIVVAPKEPAKIILAVDKTSAAQTASNPVHEKTAAEKTSAASAITETISPQNKNVPPSIIEKTSPATANLIPSASQQTVSFIQGAAGPAPAANASTNNSAQAASNNNSSQSSSAASNANSAATQNSNSSNATSTSTDDSVSSDNATSTAAASSAPETTLLSFPSTTATSTTAIFEFSSSVASSTFVCQIDNATSTSCVSPKEYNNLSEGAHNFNVKAKDSAGNEDATPAEYQWNIDAEAPVISGIQAQTGRDSAAISWLASEVGVFQIEYGATADYGFSSATTSLVSLTVNELSPGAQYHFRVLSKDSLGNATQSADNVFTTSAQAQNVIISEVQISGPASTTDEFVELYNPTGAAINLAGWRLTKKTASGATTQNLLTTFPAEEIPVRGYYLIAHPKGYAGAAVPDEVYSTSYYLAEDNTLILYSDNGKTVVDMVGLGAAQNFETQSASNPGAGQSLERKANATSTDELLANGGHKWLGNGYDINNNSQDFVLQSKPSPQNSLMLAEPRESVPGLMSDSSWPTWQRDQKRSGRADTPIFASSSMAIKWTLAINPYASQPILDRDGNIYVGTQSSPPGEVGFSKVSPSGQELWHFASSTSYDMPVITQDGSIYFRGAWGLFALNNDGRFKWKFPLSESASGKSAVGVLSDGALITTSGPKVYAVNQDATLKWIFDPGRNLMSASTISPPVIDGQDNIYFGIDDYLYAISTTGALLWEKDLGLYRSAIMLGPDNNLYVSALYSWFEGRVYVIDAKTGDIKFAITPSPSAFQNSRSYLSPVLDLSGNIILPLMRAFEGAGSGYLYAFRNNSTSSLWVNNEINLGFDFSYLAAPIITSDDKIYLADNSRIYIFDATDGKSLGFFDAGYNSSGLKYTIHDGFGAVAKDGTIYTSERRGLKLYAIGGATSD